MKKIPKLIFLILLINLGLAGVQLYFASIRASDGDLIDHLTLQKEVFTRINLDYSAQIFHLSSLSYIQDQAKLANLVPAVSKFVSPIPLAVASFSP